MALIRLAFIALFLRPLARVFTGVDVIGAQNLPRAGPAILAANHTSHVDTLVLLSLFPARLLPKVRPVAAADYFLKGPLISWFSKNLVGIVPIERAAAGQGVDVLTPLRAALAEGAVLILFPEGTRGQPVDELGHLKGGIARLARDFPEAPVIPVWLQGAGRVLPKGAHLPTPLNCTALVGEPVGWRGDHQAFLAELRERLEALKGAAPPQRWA
ncbi:MAG TPA: lysophospholipid acyltransferase family protein [Caulobacteraceae bacterium]|nr:lysophospholipid acyltransferase family protein [Caulobacteraceae bacterium]